MSKPYLTQLDVEGWELDDGELAHAARPDSYWIPSLERRQALVPGAVATLVFTIRTEDASGEVIDNAERLWVRVLGRVDDWYRGELANEPACTDEMVPGMELWFQPRHVVDITPMAGEEAANDVE